MDRYVFAVAESTFCCWQPDAAQLNRDFLATFDSSYFSYPAQLFASELEAENSQRASIALRMAYHHAMETLFSLLGATAQAPQLVPAWLPHCTTTSLRAVVNSIACGKPMLTQAGRHRVTFDMLAATVHRWCWVDETPIGATASRFATFWRRIAHEWLSQHNIAEYNSLKHGFRFAPGGFTLQFGEEMEYGVPAPEENMVTVGHSDYGSSVILARPMIDGKAAGHHFTMTRSSLNWSVEAMILQLQLLSWSINNVVAGLRCLNGAAPSTVQFRRPEDPLVFENAWESDIGVFASHHQEALPSSRISLLPKHELVRELESRATKESP